MDRPVKAMGILDGIVEWIAEQIMYGLDMINTSVLGALGCDMNTFLRYFPAAETMYSLLVALAIGLILLGWVWNLFKNYGLGLGVDAEDPVRLTAKAILFIVLAYYADEIVNIALTIGGTPYAWILSSELPSLDFASFNSVLLTIIGVCANGGVALIVLILTLILAWNYIIRKHSGTILGELDHQVICIPPKTRFNGNLAVYGASGSKKTRAFCVNMILQCAARKSSLVICDPKSELYEKTSEYLRDQGYTVRVFNLVTPSASDSWNCLAEIGDQELMAQLFCDVIIKNTGGEERDHFWDSAEMNLLKALVLYVSTSYPKKKQNIGEVYQLLTASSEKELNALFDVLPLTHPAKAPYSIFKQASEGVRGGVIIGLGSRLQVFQNRDIRNITSYNEIDLELPGKQPCAYYCITSDQDSTFDFLSSLFLSFVFIRLVRYADEHCPGGALPVPVHVLGEELCACGVIPDLSRKISVIRSRNLSMSCVFQNLAGLQNRYPYNQWQEILGNCDVQLFLGCTDALTAEFISDRTGEASISVTSKAKQLGTWRVSNYTPEYRETSGVGRRKLMTMDEVLRMDVDKALIIIRGKNVLEVDKYDYSKHPEAKKLRPSKAASHVPAWRANQPQEKQTPSAPPSQAAEKKPAQKKKPASTEKVVTVTKESIMKKKEDT